LPGQGANTLKYHEQPKSSGLLPIADLNRNGCLIRALFFGVETEGQPPAETELRSMEPRALNVADNRSSPWRRSWKTDLLTNAPTGISMGCAYRD